MTKYLLWWATAWILIGSIVYYFVGKETPDVIYGIAVAAGISLIFLIKMLLENYEGEIVEIKEEVYYVSDDDGPQKEKKVVAIICMPNGKTKKLQAMPGYAVGNYLKKVRGEASVRVLTKRPEYYQLSPDDCKKK